MCTSVHAIEVYPRYNTVRGPFNNVNPSTHHRPTVWNSIPVNFPPQPDLTLIIPYARYLACLVLFVSSTSQRACPSQVPCPTSVPNPLVVPGQLAATWKSSTTVTTLKQFQAHSWHPASARSLRAPFSTWCFETELLDPPSHWD